MKSEGLLLHSEELVILVRVQWRQYVSFIPHILKVDKSKNLPSKHWNFMWSLMKLLDKTFCASMCIVLHYLQCP